MIFKVKIRTVSQAVQFFATKRIIIFDINCSLGIMGQFFRRNFMEVDMLFINAEMRKPARDAMERLFGGVFRG